MMINRLQIIEESKLYEAVYQFSKKRVLFYYLRIDFDELVNDAYLAVLESGNLLTEENLFQQVNKLSFEYKNALTTYSEKEINETSFKYCKCCKTDLPIAAFGMTTRKNTGKRSFQVFCMDCITENAKKKRRAMGVKEITYHEYPDHIITGKQKAAFRHKVWQQNNKDKVAANNMRCKMKAMVA